MCRSIKTLRRVPPPATAEEIRAAALQFVRKISGTRNPPAALVGAYDNTVAEIAAATERLLTTMGPPRVSARTAARKTEKDAGQQPRV
jgi:hypothetical protein